MYGTFWLDGDFSASTSRFHKGICFLSWQNFFLLYFFLFLLRSLFRSWFFHKQRASTCEFYKMQDVNRIWKLHENRALTWAVAATINSPRIFSQVRKKGTFLIYQLLFENTFLELTRLLLKISEYFFFKKTLRPLKVVSNLNHLQVANSKPALRMCKCILLDLVFYNKAR